MQQTTLVLLKPDCVQRNLMGEVIGRFERKGLTAAEATDVTDLNVLEGRAPTSPCALLVTRKSHETPGWLHLLPF